MLMTGILKQNFKADAGLEFNISKTSILPGRGVTQQVAFDVAQDIIIVSPDLKHLSADLALASFCPEGFVGIGVPIATDLFVRDFVATTCRDIIDDVEKLDAIQDGFIHFQLLRVWQATRLQYINSHLMLHNRCVLQQQHVDCKIADALLKKGTKQNADGWDASSKDWAHMVLHLPYAEGGFGVTFNDVTKDAAFNDDFILLHHALWPGLVPSPRNVRSCGCLKMTYGTRPRGHRPRSHSFVTSIPSFLHSTTARRSTQGLVLDSALRMVSLSSRRLILSCFLSSTASLRLPLSGMRSLPPMLTLLSSLHSIGSPNRYSATGSPSRISNSCHCGEAARDLWLQEISVRPPR
jgi:hypothetical protein